MKTSQSLLTGPADSVFLGAESLCGYSVETCTANIVQNVQEERHLPVHKIPDEQSVAAYPIQRGGYVAGCFFVSSPQPDIFPQRIQYLLQIYAYLLGLAFETDMFYAPGQIRLRPMPAAHIQHRYILEFPEHVLSILRRDSSLSRLEAESQAWQQIEETLLALPSDRELG